MAHPQRPETAGTVATDATQPKSLERYPYGRIKDWLTRSLAVALRGGGETLDRRDIERRALTVAQCAKMLAEAVEGERRLAETEEEQAQLRRNLGLEVETPHARSQAPAQQRRRVGQRNPVRDPVGMKSA